MPDDGKKARLLDDVSPEQLRAATDELLALLAERLPLGFQPEPSWELVATAFIARAGTLVDSITALAEQDHQADALALLRVMCEHTTTFCWLAIDPEANVAEWRRWDQYRLKKLHQDAKPYGVELLSPTELVEIGDPPRPKSLPELAEAVDRYWPDHSPAFRPHDPQKKQENVLTFRGLYSAAAMFGLALAALVLFWLGLISADVVLPLEMNLMFPVMVVVMGLRFDEYAGHPRTAPAAQSSPPPPTA